MKLLGLSPEQEQEGRVFKFIGVFAKNREEWACTDIAAIKDSLTIIPFYDSLGPAALEFVIKQTELTTMCLDAGGFDHTLKAKANCPSLKNLLLFDEVSPAQLD
mmetsp:Transcript_34595/g.25758  ORF Transcript_34595/g.25758 Transcript_34595/m.25758 type:complete len:104 (+) Transcript_34595:310-621(+)